MFDTPCCPHNAFKQEMTKFVNYKLDVYGFELVRDVLLERAISLNICTNIHLAFDENLKSNVFLKKRLKDKVLKNCKEIIERDIDMYIDGYLKEAKTSEDSNE